MTPKPVDLAEAKRNLFRFAAVQGVLLAVVAAVLLARGGGEAGDARRLAWLAVLPLGIALWGVVYWRLLTRAQAAGGTVEAFRDANRRALKVLGLVGALWFAGLVVVLFL